MTQRIVQADGPAAFLAHVPALVGFVPTESLVLVAFRGTRTDSAMRISLPGPLDEDGAARFANTVSGMICRIEGVDGLVPVAYTAEPFADAPHHLLELVADRARRAGLAVRDLLCVAGDRWGRVPDGPGGPLAELGTPMRGLLDPRAELALPDADPDAIARFEQDLRRWTTRPDGPGGTVHGYAPGAGLGGLAFGLHAGRAFPDRVLDGLDAGPLIEAMLRPHDPASRGCSCRAALAAFADRPALRDLVLLQLGWGPAFGDRVRRETLLDAGPAADDIVARAFTGGDVARPSVQRITDGLGAVKDALTHRAPSRRAPLYACAAWLEWALGRGSLAGAFVDRALETDRRHGLALLLAELLSRGVLPEWAYRERPRGSRVLAQRRIA